MSAAQTARATQTAASSNRLGGLAMPKRTIELLDLLESRGFSDTDFRVIHHGTDETLHGMRSYCHEHDSFVGPGSTNNNVRERLEIIAKAYRAGGFNSPSKPGVFKALAEAAVAELPKE
jgi:hypothetical protein